MAEQLYSYLGRYPEKLPEKVRLLDSNLTVRVREGLDPDLLKQAGWTGPHVAPSYDPAEQVLEWDEKKLEFTVRKKSVPERLREGESKIAQMRVDRNDMLRESDSDVLKFLELGRPVPQELLEYRQQLRDLPANTEDPFNIAWPVLDRFSTDSLSIPQKKPARKPSRRRSAISE